MKQRKTPQRTCRGCMAVKGKRELIRVVRIPDGTVEVDLTGKKAGRGAYICPDKSCLEKAIKTNRLEMDLEVQVDDAVYERLRSEIPVEHT